MLVLSSYIVATAEDLLSLFAADFGCLSIGEEAKVRPFLRPPCRVGFLITPEIQILGEVNNSQELLAVLEYLRVKCYTFVLMFHSLTNDNLMPCFCDDRTVQVTQNITLDFPDIDYAAGFSTIAGFLTVPLSREGKDFIVFCRRGQLEVRTISSSTIPIADWDTVFTSTFDGLVIRTRTKNNSKGALERWNLESRSRSGVRRWLVSAGHGRMSRWIRPRHYCKSYRLKNRRTVLN